MGALLFAVRWPCTDFRRLLTVLSVTCLRSLPNDRVGPAAAGVVVGRLGHCSAQWSRGTLVSCPVHDNLLFLVSFRLVTRWGLMPGHRYQKKKKLKDR